MKRTIPIALVFAAALVALITSLSDAQVTKPGGGFVPPGKLGGGGGGGAGTITGVTAGSGATGGGTSGTVVIDVGSGSGILVDADHVAVDQSYVQRRVSSSCSVSGQFMTAIAADGTPTCTAEPGDISGVSVTAPITGGGTSGAVTIGISMGSGMTLSSGSLIADISTGLAFSFGHITVDETREQRRVSGTCTSPNAIATVNSDGSVVCTTGVLNTSNVSGSLNVIAKFTGTNVVGNSLVSDDGTTFSINGGKFTVTDASGNFVALGTGSIGGALNMNSHLINNVTDPSGAQDAATKNYVDNSTNTAVTGTANTVPKFTGTHAIGNSSVTDNGTTWAVNTNKFTVTEASGNTTIAGTETCNGNVTVNAIETINVPTASTGETISQTHTAQASTAIGLLYDDTGATHGGGTGSGGGTDAYGVKVNEVSGCSVASCSLANNYGIWTSASGATTTNIALWTDQGNVILNGNGGTTSIGGAASLNAGATVSSGLTVSSGGEAVTGGLSTDTLTVTGSTNLVIDPTKVVTYFDDFTDANLATNAISTGGFAANFSGTSASVNQLTDETGHPGILRLNTGTTATGRAALVIGNNASESFIFGGNAYSFDILVRPATLCDSVTNVCTIACGFIDSITTADSTDGCYLKFDPAASSNWRTVCVNSGTKTEADTSPAAAPSANTWQHLAGTVNSGGTSVSFKVGGAAAGTVTTNIPSGAGRAFGFGCMILKSAGTTGRTVDIDYAQLTASGLSR